MTAITKSQCDKYLVRADGEWGEFFVTDGGTLAIHSSFGSYSYHWGCHGRKTFKHFILEIEDDYLLGKFVGRKSQFNLDATIKALKKEICQIRRDGGYVRDPVSRLRIPCSKQLARADFDQIDEIASDIPSPDVLAERTLNELNVIEDFDGIFQYEWPVQAVMLLKKLWPPFVEAIKREIASGEPDPSEKAMHDRTYG